MRKLKQEQNPSKSMVQLLIKTAVINDVFYVPKFTLRAEPLSSKAYVP